MKMVFYTVNKNAFKVLFLFIIGKIYILTKLKIRFFGNYDAFLMADSF